MEEMTENIELQMLLNNIEEGHKYRERRIPQWRENYELYRDHVTINRLTQRQSVNLPVMKTTLRTVLKDVDDMPVIVFENLDNDKEAEIFQNEYWKWTLEQNNAEIQDIVDKKQDFFFGRTFDFWQVEDGRITFNIEDTEDILVSRFMNPYDIDSSRFLIHLHIFVPLSSLKNNPDYDQKEVRDLERFFKTQMGIIKANDNFNMLTEKNQKMANLGVQDVDDPIVGETYVELTRHHVFKSGEKKKGKELPDQIFVYVTAENRNILMKKPQEEIIGVTKEHFWRNHYLYNSWGDDIDKQDFWTDGIADIARTPNKVMNAWYSQLVENRTLRNYGMHYYNASLKDDGFQPSTIEPGPFKFIPIPAGGQRLSDVFEKVDIPDLSESLDEMNYVAEMVEKATGAVATKQGVQTERQATLGEIRALQGEATERTKGLSKFYTKAWEQRAYKFLMLIEAASDKLDAVRIYKKGRATDNIFSREISPKDWMTKSGYKVRVWSQDEKDAKDNLALQKIFALKQAMPDNPKVSEIFTRKMAEYASLSPDEVTEILDYEKRKLVSPMLGGGMVADQGQMPMQQQQMQMQPQQLQL